MILRVLRWLRRRRTPALVVVRCSERFAAYAPVPYNPHPDQQTFWSEEGTDAGS